MSRTGGFALVVVLVLAIAGAGQATAGGSWFYPIEENLQPGDSVTMVGFSGFASGGDDEAFFGYLELDPDTSVAGMIGADRADLLPLGQITVTDGGECCWATYRLHISFTLPADLVPGYYDFLHCNDPCTTGFGELIAGVIRVGDPPSRLIDGQVVHYQRADLTYPPVAELATTATAPAELAATGWSAQRLLVGVLLVTIGISATTAARRQARGTP